MLQITIELVKGELVLYGQIVVANANSKQIITVVREDLVARKFRLVSVVAFVNSEWATVDFKILVQITLVSVAIVIEADLLVEVIGCFELIKRHITFDTRVSATKIQRVRGRRRSTYWQEIFALKAYAWAVIVLISQN